MHISRTVSWPTASALAFISFVVAVFVWFCFLLPFFHDQSLVVVNVVVCFVVAVFSSVF